MFDIVKYRNITIYEADYVFGRNDDNTFSALKKRNDLIKLNGIGEIDLLRFISENKGLNICIILKFKDNKEGELRYRVVSQVRDHYKEKRRTPELLLVNY